MDHIINDNMNLKPSALYRQAESGSTQFDLNLNFSFKNTIHFGLGYIGNFSENTNFGPLVTLSINFNNIKTLLSQEFTMSEVSNYSSGTTEVTFKYEFKPKKSEKEKNEEEEEEEEKEEEKSRLG